MITHGGPDRRYEICRCSKCGIEALCTPSFDFYTRNKLDEEPDGLPLFCEGCERERYADMGLKFGTVVNGRLEVEEAS